METANPYGSSREHFVPFRVAATVVELNQDTSPGIEFPGRTSQISRSSICIFTRRMVYESTSLLIILPLLDDRPCVLGGLVSKCEYDAAGEYRIVVDFSRHCRSRLVEAWVKQNNYAWWQDRNGGDDHDTDAQSSSRAAG